MDVFEEAEQLSRVPLFAKLDKAKLKLVAFTSEQLSLSDKEFLFHKGDQSDSVYLILEGFLNLVSKNETGEYEVIIEQGKNQITGEMGVIRNVPRAGTIRAAGPAKVLKIEADTFMTLMLENPCMSLHVMRELSNRLHQALNRETDALGSKAATQ